MSEDQDPAARVSLTVSARDLDELSGQLAHWLAGAVGAPVTVKNLSKPSAGGMSSTTILFDARWQSGETAESGSFVLRMAPEDGSFPVFESYDLPMQYQVMSGVAASSTVAVPPLRWLETDESVFGSPFLVMEKVEGRAPSDNPPYVFFGWLFDATAEERARIADATVEVITQVHTIDDAARRFPLLDGEGSALRRHFQAQRAWYAWALTDHGVRVPLIERSFDWLEDHWPADPGPEVLNWGDARPGNILFDGFTPAAVLDWEMATLGPRELDLGWIIFIHRFFQDIATRFDQPGLPDFLRRDAVVAKYEELSGHSVRDLDFYIVYAALRHAIVMARIKCRMIHFGEDTVPDDPDDYVMHRLSLEALLDGTYEWD
ncbi:phosphotransferase family protein [Nocardia asteroides]|uniref:phosphotransferase family protein n=1 Tax=Nocardia asteroides TaxID=1824 RepID=UPI001E60F188|nr:phosphotransferase family protein [Nocardia asteroides]UGT56796.1 phosphotransferase family protein [Nocardia asteroides]